MSEERDETLRRWFEKAIDLDSEGRKRVIGSVEDEQLRAELQALLAADANPAVALPSISGPGWASDEPVPERIGPYAIRGVVGEGGMGVVYRAEEIGPLARPVAVKVLRRELSSTVAAARFEAEREALSVMDHPNVARVYDAGATADGRLYIALELVNGRPITEHCDAERLDVDARLGLFLQVCDGVQHAHERGVIHRDLNPSNILVTTSGGRATAKIIDFGIAKLAGAVGRRSGPRTEAGVLVGTPEYMSPEQVTMRPGAGDTRTDVWALGLLLYELLTGELPYDREQLGRAGLIGLKTAILEGPLPAPWARLRQLDEGRGWAIAAARRSDPGALARRVRGDLSRVALKAIERDRARRYASPHELAADVRRHLRLEPVLAGSPGWGYRAGRFLARHRRAIAAAAAVAAVAGSLVVTAAVQARRAMEATDRARHELRTAEAMSRFVVDFLMGPPAAASRDDSVDAESLLDRGAARALDRIEISPSVRASLLHAFGEARRRIGRPADAEPLLREAERILEGLLGSVGSEILPVRDSLARIHQDLGRHETALAMFREGWERRRVLLGEDDPETLRALSRIGLCLKTARRYADAESVLDRCAEAMERTLGADHPDTLVVQSYRIAGLIELGRVGEALELFRTLVPRSREVLGPGHIETRAVSYNLACAYAAAGRSEEAIEALAAFADAGMTLAVNPWSDTQLAAIQDDPRFGSIVRRMTLNDAGHRQSAYQRALGLRNEGRPGEAEAILREIFEAEKRVGGDNASTFETRFLLADVLFLQGRYADAVPLLEALERENASTAFPAYTSSEFLAFLAQCRLALEDRAGAVAALDAAARDAAEHPHTVNGLYVAAWRAALDGDAATARRTFEDAERRGLPGWWWRPRDAHLGAPWGEGVKSSPSVAGMGKAHE